MVSTRQLPALPRGCKWRRVRCRRTMEIPQCASPAHVVLSRYRFGRSGHSSTGANAESPHRRGYGGAREVTHLAGHFATHVGMDGDDPVVGDQSVAVGMPCEGRRRATAPCGLLMTSLLRTPHEVLAKIRYFALTRLQPEAGFDESRATLRQRRLHKEAYRQSPAPEALAAPQGRLRSQAATTRSLSSRCSSPISTAVSPPAHGASHSSAFPAICSRHSAIVLRRVGARG